ncbi:hypothetical protein F5984_26050 [Rudanella paleaurantiibacter]|uniref:Sigma-70 family RNA polymerase sigma factor n=1 Tax=Rudanella paleaurantiibacter TaxID=2614655 RepID=A0A7J5TRY9_9BACT|nr:hypothetical protein [Rudanella paleaurantiibacter]KAB7725505.1 hypothetical protein F5984_26050 [Rudanella paleaurantiibacter]
MNYNDVHQFISTNQKAIYRSAYAAAHAQFWAHKRPRNMCIDAREVADVVQEVLLKICTQPFALNSEDLDLDRFNRKVGNMVRNEVSERNRRAKRTHPADPTTEMSDEALFEWLIAEAEEEMGEGEFQNLVAYFIKKVDMLIVEYDKKNFESWFVLTEWKSGKSLQETATEGGLTLAQVKNARKRIRSALRNPRK